MLIEDFREPKNISRWWNLGLEMAENWNRGLSDPSEEFVVAILNDDVIVRPGFVQQLGRAIIRHDVVAASANVWGFGLDRVFCGESPRVMAGFAFALRGKTGLRADEDFVWWGGDTDLDVRAQRNGGLVVVAEATVQHLYPNSTTVGELAEQAGRDRETFKRKHGFYAW